MVTPLAIVECLQVDKGCQCKAVRGEHSAPEVQTSKQRLSTFRTMTTSDRVLLKRTNLSSSTSMQSKTAVPIVFIYMSSSTLKLPTAKWA